jgi:hypothetical protein
VQLGDMVKMKRGYSTPGLVIDISETNLGKWVRVLWSDNHFCDYQPTSLERYSDVEVHDESR